MWLIKAQQSQWTKEYQEACPPAHAFCLIPDHWVIIAKGLQKPLFTKHFSWSAVIVHPKYLGVLDISKISF